MTLYLPTVTEGGRIVSQMTSKFILRNLQMIDNPLPDQVMAEMDKVAHARNFEEKCREDAKELCKQNDVFSDLIEYFQDWYFLYCVDHPEEISNVISAEDVDLINTWWDEEADLYDDYISPYEDYDPTPDGDSPYSDAEYIITPEERNRMAFESKRESHGRGNPFNW